MAADQKLYRRALANAIQAAGGEDALREYLKVNEITLRTWLTGLKPIPENVFLRLIDLLLDSPHNPTAPPQGGDTTAKRKS